MQELAESVQHLLRNHDAAPKNDDVGERAMYRHFVKQAVPRGAERNHDFLVEGADRVQSHDIAFSPYLDAAVRSKRTCSELVCVSFG